jgi:hypothetical protein
MFVFAFLVTLVRLSYLWKWCNASKSPKKPMFAVDVGRREIERKRKRERKREREGKGEGR